MNCQVGKYIISNVSNWLCSFTKSLIFVPIFTKSAKISKRRDFSNIYSSLSLRCFLDNVKVSSYVSVLVWSFEKPLIVSLKYLPSPQKSVSHRIKLAFLKVWAANIFIRLWKFQVACSYWFDVLGFLIKRYSCVKQVKLTQSLQLAFGYDCA